MAAMVTESSPGSWTIYIEDQTQGWHYTNTFAYSVAAQTAEWIEEAPTVDGSQSTLAGYRLPTAFSSLGVSGTDTSAVGVIDVDLIDASNTIIAYPTSFTSTGFSVFYASPLQPSVTSISPASGRPRGGVRHDSGQRSLRSD